MSLYSYSDVPQRESCSGNARWAVLKQEIQPVSPSLCSNFQEAFSPASSVPPNIRRQEKMTPGSIHGTEGCVWMLPPSRCGGRAVQSCYGRSCCSLRLCTSRRSVCTAPRPGWQLPAPAGNIKLSKSKQKSWAVPGQGASARARGEAGAGGQGWCESCGWRHRGCVWWCSIPWASPGLPQRQARCLQDFGTGRGTTAAVQKPVAVGVLLSPEIMRYMVCVSWKTHRTVAALLMVRPGGRVCDGDRRCSGLLGYLCWRRSPTASDQPRENIGSSFQTLASKAILGLEEMRGTRSPCLVEQSVWAEAGGERLLSFPTWQKLYCIFSTTIKLCWDGCRRVLWKSSRPHPTMLISAVQRPRILYCRNILGI